MNHKINPWAPLALGFRPFFLFAIWFAVLLMAGSLAGFIVGFWPDTYFALPQWHAHEMVFGYTVAVIAGFLLTSVRNWTGLPTPTGYTLALLVLLWFMPRLLSFLPSLPPAIFALIDTSFLPVLAIVLGRLVLKAKQSRNYPVPLLLLLLACCNAAMHLQQLGILQASSIPFIQLSVIVIIALIALIAGRVVPFFMRGAIGNSPASYPLMEKLALPSILLFCLAITIQHSGFIIASALLAALIHGARLSGWFDIAILKQPMLWVLHAGYAWLVVGFLAYAALIFWDQSIVPAIHAWTLGAIGLFTTGMIARVALGHTGRAIQPLPWIATAFLMIFAASAVRVILPLILPELTASAVLGSGLCWIVAFIIIGFRYTSILLHARVDGKPG